ncbi:DUF4159 domain-containing protein [Blastochloris viridis]|uniref:Membrane protein n=1 Tax=Blastochloris viridis TaxID=1079 RepID=A0A0H5BHA5_BLAVI|nr:DUF4159 domain-containing protein [Blastochloris viridis]ALK10263.1 hypothetical protein BVIR_2497 [Blastochloris viridis]BAR99806.1 membrane protein [Blastochloris viridis]CUU42925.1 hypothetical protein BVIRIDIS_19410 [Blastochloris viridis]
MLPLAFTTPLLLIALAALPLLWWLLRLVPPRPRRVEFPPARLLLDIAPREQTPARSPWWLLLLRLLLAALVILAAAGPIWNPPPATPTTRGPLVLLIDNGWSAAATWERRIAAAEALIAEAEASGRGVAVVPTAEPAREASVRTPGEARVRLRALKPQPHTPDRRDVLPALAKLLGSGEQSLVWLSDATDTGDGAAFVAGLGRIAGERPVTVLAGGLPPARALAGTANAGSGLSVTVLRAFGDHDAGGIVRAVDLKGLPLGQATFAFNGDTLETKVAFDLPIEIRNDIARLEIVGERSSGAVQLLDERWRRRTIGIVTGSTADTAQPLLAASFYLGRAIEPFADVRLAERTSPGEAAARFVDMGLPLIALADVGTLAGDARDRLIRWVEGGGVLVRFAGPRLAAGGDELLPVKVRPGGRVLGGKLSWEQPQKIGSFAKDGPFADLAIPADVTVRRQVLAEPDGLLFERTWAALADGTPLVTGARRGKGVMVLFHVSADTSWSDLPLSGTFVDMLRRIVALAGSGSGGAKPGSGEVGATVPPSRLLDGFGAFQPPSAATKPLPAGFAGRGTADNPPGFYGVAEALVAVNTLAPDDRLKPLDVTPLGAAVEPYRAGDPIDLRRHVLVAAFALLLLDALVVLVLAGGLARLMPSRRTSSLLVVAAALALAPDPGHAQPPAAAASPPSADDFAISALAKTRLAYVITGDSEIDRLSRAGLEGLSRFLSQRTALESAEPIGVDPARDELAFFPLLYWPVTPAAAKPSAATLARIDAFMKNGGTILFDTRDALEVTPGGRGATPGIEGLRAILSSLDIPALEPVPRDHVLTKSFYILREFPGRYAAGSLWVEALPAATEEDGAKPARSGDGVSPIIITSNDLAGAWAIEPSGEPMLPLVPGDPRQREMAYRVGANIVMYVLTGNYKADQVHIPALLERLGQ